MIQYTFCWVVKFPFGVINKFTIIWFILLSLQISQGSFISLYAVNALLWNICIIGEVSI